MDPYFLAGQDVEIESDAVGNLVEEIVSKVTLTNEGKGVGGDLVKQDEAMDESGLGIVPKKKLKEDRDDNMEIDENELLTSENKENIVKGLKRMSRKDLEDLVLVKVVESLVKHSEAGKFRTKILELQTQKDKMFQRVGHLQKQVQELSKALKLLVDNHNRDPNNLNPNKKRAPPIKFYRSVGLQVTIEPSFRNGPAKVIHVSNNGSPVNGLKPLNGTTHNIQANLPAKRPGPKSLTEPKPTRVANGQQNVVTTGLKQLNAQMASSPSKVNGVPPPTAVAISTQQPRLSLSSVTPTVVDLTDDIALPVTVTTADATLMTSANGFQYRIVNAPSSQGVQMLPSAFQIVTTANPQGRPVLLTQANTQQRPTQTFVLRNVAPKPIAPNLIAPRPANVVYNRPAAVVSTNFGPRSSSTVVGTIVRPQQQPVSATKKIQLPPLPPSGMVQVPRGRVLKDLPPKPSLTLHEQADGIVLSWTMKLSLQHAEISSYQIFACQESLATSPGKVSSWKKVGDVKALPLPMACTLSQFTQGNRYFFIVRAIDAHSRSGAFCDPGPIILHKKPTA